MQTHKCAQVRVSQYQLGGSVDKPEPACGCDLQESPCATASASVQNDWKQLGHVKEMYSRL